MKHPRPIRRMVDGRPTDRGTTISRRLTLLMVPMISGANAAGATVVFVLAGYVVPAPPVADEDGVLLINLVALGAFGAFAIPVGIALGYRRLSTTRVWLRAEREPDARERRRTLRAPMRQLTVNAALWLLATLVFAALNAVFSLGLALVAAITVLLGGVTTCAVAYLLTERVIRPIVARALAAGVRTDPCSPASSHARCSRGRWVAVFGAPLPRETPPTGRWPPPARSRHGSARCPRCGPASASRRGGCWRATSAPSSASSTRSSATRQRGRAADRAGQGGGRRGAGLRGDPHPQGAPRAARRAGRQAGPDRLPHRRQRRRPGPREPPRRRMGSQVSKARFEFDWHEQFAQAIDPEVAQGMHDETLADDYFKSAEFCSMCGPKYCPMHNSRDVDWDAIRTVVKERKAQRAVA